MKQIIQKVVPIIIVMLCATAMYAQDVIYKTNGESMKVKVIELTEDGLIKYKDFDYLDGPTRNIKKTEVFMIRYENGKEEAVTTQTTESGRAVQTTHSAVQTSTPAPVLNPYKFRMYIGLGSGHSYGGVFGTSIEARIRDLGISAGLGIMPTVDGEDVFAGWSFGVKWYIWKNLYWNTTIGTIGSYETFVDYGYGWNNYDYAAITGGSELFGVQWSWGSNVRFGINAALGFAYGIDYSFFTVAYDFGISISFGTKGRR